MLTNKPIRFSRTMLEGLGISDQFAAVYGGNSFERKKPDPVGIFQILADTKGQAGDDMDDWRFRGRCVDRAKCRREDVRCVLGLRDG